MEFPFTDLQDVKRRPAVVLWDGGHEDVICCAISTRRSGRFEGILPLEEADVGGEGLHRPSAVHTSTIITAQRGLITKTVGPLAEGVRARVLAAVRSLFTESAAS